MAEVLRAATRIAGDVNFPALRAPRTIVRVVFVTGDMAVRVLRAGRKIRRVSLQRCNFGMLRTFRIDELWERANPMPSQIQGKMKELELCDWLNRLPPSEMYRVLMT